jgi:hypothetical protein
VRRCYAEEGVTVMPSCGGGANVVVELECEIRSF